MLHWDVLNNGLHFLFLLLVPLMALVCNDNTPVTCPEDHSCGNESVIIDAGANCLVSCSGHFSCNSLQIEQPIGIGALSIECTGDSSCNGVEIVRSRVDWICTKEDSCQAISLNCTGGACSIACSGLDSCIGAEYHCQAPAHCNATASRDTDASFYCGNLDVCKCENWTWLDKPSTTTSAATTTTTSEEASDTKSIWSTENPIFIIILVASGIVLILLIIAGLLVYKLMCINKTMALDLYSRKKDTSTQGSPNAIKSISHTTVTTGENTTTTNGATTSSNSTAVKTGTTTQPANTTKVELVQANKKEESSDEHSEEEKAEEYVTPGGPDLNKLDLDESQEEEGDYKD